jgi:hypothetical protein
MTISSLNSENLKKIFFLSLKKLMQKNFPFYHPKMIDYFLTKIYNQKNLYHQLKNNYRTILVTYEANQPLGSAMID